MNKTWEVFWEQGEVLGHLQSTSEVLLSKIPYPKNAHIGLFVELGTHSVVYLPLPICSWDSFQDPPHDPKNGQEKKKNILKIYILQVQKIMSKYKNIYLTCKRKWMC